MIKLSKSDYVLGLKCPLALWYKKHRRDLARKFDETVLTNGIDVGILAQQYFPNGADNTFKPWEPDAITFTQDAIANNASSIYEAVTKTPTGEFCAVDILRNNFDGTWDIVEVKSTTSVKDYHSLDASFQKYVFETCGYKIKNCFIMTLNSEYVRHGNLDIMNLFKLHPIDDILTPMDEVRANIERLRAVLNGGEPVCPISKQCLTKFHSCEYTGHCWSGVPKYSVFDVFRGDKGNVIFNKHKTADLRQIPEHLYAEQMHPGDIECYLKQDTVSNPPELKKFLGALEYPLYFLDYESFQPPVPIFDNSSPYQQIPFQFSLHVMDAPNGPVQHIEFLHIEQTDPRPEFIRALIDACGAAGNIIVYNISFERGRNSELARDFPEYADALNSINDRMVDLLTPFRSRHLYSYKQDGSASIKKVLPAFTEISYDGMEIDNGTMASNQYFDFIRGNMSNDDAQAMFENLRKYCGTDTIAMVELLRVIEKFV